MVSQARPVVAALVRHPDRGDILPRATELCHRLFEAIKKTCAELELPHLAAPAEAMEYLLDLARSGIVELSPAHIGLLAEALTFLEEGLPTVPGEQGDSHLAASAGKLAAAILRSVHAGPAATEEEPGGAPMDPEMQAAFVDETGALLEAAEQEFVLWDFIAVDPQRVAELCRLLGRLRKNFAFLGRQNLERLAAALESTLNRFVAGEFFQTEYPERIFIRSIDAMRTALANSDLGGDYLPELDDHLASLQGLIRQPIGELLVEAGLVDAGTVEAALQLQKASPEAAPRRLGEVLVEMGSVTRDQIQQALQTQQRKREMAARAAAAAERLGPSSSLDPGDREVGVEGQTLARMIGLIDRLATRPELTGEAATLVAELRQLAGNCRRDWVRAFAGRLQRLVHDLSVEFGRKVRFRLEGVEELLDQEDAVLLAEPLGHLLQNAVKHGLEAAVDRERAGKGVTGRLGLLALRRDGQLWVSVEDDGRGMDPRRIIGWAVARGLVEPDRSETLTGTEIARLLLHPPDADLLGAPLPGLATVKASLQPARGAVDIHSLPGKGTRITLKIPKQG
jgi:two-component system chemotaxis sensor kinase CheA